MLGPVELVDEVDSTNRVLLDRARDGAPHGLVLVADHQTVGRGRLDRRWEAPWGASLLVSVLLRPDIRIGRLHLVTMAGGLAAVDACRAVGAADVGLKWPNDVVAPAGKLAGLLAEAIVAGTSVEAVVVGMGLNLDWGGHPLPEGGASLAQLVVGPVRRDRILGLWVDAFDCRLERLDDVRADFLRECTTIGRRVRVNTSSGTVEGVAESITDEGHLVVDGTVITVGDVTHLRPA